MSRVVRTYGQYAYVTDELVDDPGAIGAACELVARRLDRWLADRFLIPDGPTSTSVKRGMDFRARGLSVALAERRAAGLPPEERLPQGWRAFFMAP